MHIWCKYRIAWRRAIPFLHANSPRNSLRLFYLLLYSNLCRLLFRLESLLSKSSNFYFLYGWPQIDYIFLFFRCRRCFVIGRRTSTWKRHFKLKWGWGIRVAIYKYCRSKLLLVHVYLFYTAFINTFAIFWNATLLTLCRLVVFGHKWVLTINCLVWDIVAGISHH